MLDGHADLIKYFKLPDGNEHLHHFAKVELVPKDWTDVATWKWTVDEPTVPIWWADIAEQAKAALRARTEQMILRDGNHELIIEGCWIVAGTAKVRDVRSGRILRVGGSAQIYDVWGSAQIYGVGDNAQIHGVGGSAQIYGVGGSAQIYDVGDNAQIYDVRDNAQIYGVRDNAQIYGVRDNAQIHGVRDNAQIHGVRGRAIIDDSARSHCVMA